jgi:Holliday junction resolvase
MRQAARRDTNETAIVTALEGVGCSVYRLSQAGIPDLLVGRQGVTYLLEVKERKGSLTEDQETFFESWNGCAAVVRTVEEALEVIGL